MAATATTAAPALFSARATSVRSRAPARGNSICVVGASRVRGLTVRAAATQEEKEAGAFTPTRSRVSSTRATPRHVHWLSWDIRSTDNSS